MSNRAGRGLPRHLGRQSRRTNLHEPDAEHAESMEGAPTWSPGGNQIAFTSDRPGSNQIYLMNADGTGVRRLTFEQQVDRPTWSA